MKVRSSQKGCGGRRRVRPLQALRAGAHFCRNLPSDLQTFSIILKAKQKTRQYSICSVDFLALSFPLNQSPRVRLCWAFSQARRSFAADLLETRINTGFTMKAYVAALLIVIGVAGVSS